MTAGGSWSSGDRSSSQRASASFSHEDLSESSHHHHSRDYRDQSGHSMRSRSPSRSRGRSRSISRERSPSRESRYSRRSYRDRSLDREKRSHHHRYSPDDYSRSPSPVSSSHYHSHHRHSHHHRDYSPRDRDDYHHHHHQGERDSYHHHRSSRFRSRSRSRFSRSDEQRGPAGRRFGERENRWRPSIVERGSEEDRLASKTLFVGSIPYSFEERDIMEMFEPLGPLVKISLPIDRYTGRNKGFTFVEYQERKDAEAAMEKFSQFELQGRRLKLDWDVGMMKKNHLRPGDSSFSSSAAVNAEAFPDSQVDSQMQMNQKGDESSVPLKTESVSWEEEESVVAVAPEEDSSTSGW